MRIINFLKQFKKEKKETPVCVRCREIGIKKEAKFNLIFNGFNIEICEHHMKEFIETLKKDKDKINSLEDIKIINTEDIK